MNVSLTPEMEKFIENCVKSGRYVSASEVVREAMRLLQDQEKLREIRLEELDRELQKGLDASEAGDVYEDLTVDDIMGRTDRLRARRRKAAG